MARSPTHKTDIGNIQKQLHGFLKGAGLDAVPRDLAGYLKVVDDIVRRWQQQGAVAIKFYDAYLRTLRIADVPEAQASALFAKASTLPLSRDEYLAVQDFIWRHILLEAGRINLPVPIHSSLGVPPFLRSLESDVRNLEDVLADPRFFATPIVLIHGGGPWHEIAAYLAMKPNVWVDISSIGFLSPVPDFADILRVYLLFAPQKVLYGTDAASYPSQPGGADVQHLVLSRTTRDALYLALADLVRDGVIDESRAIEMGRGVLRDNARRLYRWNQRTASSIDVPPRFATPILRVEGMIEGRRRRVVSAKPWCDHSPHKVVRPGGAMSERGRISVGLGDSWRRDAHGSTL